MTSLEVFQLVAKFIILCRNYAVARILVFLGA